jgi:hypothetical protein
MHDEMRLLRTLAQPDVDFTLKPVLHCGKSKFSFQEELLIVRDSKPKMPKCMQLELYLMTLQLFAKVAIHIIVVTVRGEDASFATIGVPPLLQEEPDEVVVQHLGLANIGDHELGDVTVGDGKPVF